MKNFSYTVVDGEVFYRENSVMTQVELSDTAKGRVTGMVELRQIVNELIEQQLNDYPDADIKATQERLNAAYDAFTAKYGLLNDRKNGRLFEQDSSYYLLCSLENLDEQGQLKSKAAMFTKRTIRPERTVTSVDTPSEALAVSIGEHGKVDLPYMAELLGTPGEYGRITTELSGVIFKDPAADPTDPEAGWQMADEYLSGDVRAKLRMAQFAAETNPEFAVNVEALTKAQPRELEASEIDVRLGATWLDPGHYPKVYDRDLPDPLLSAPCSQSEIFSLYRRVACGGQDCHRAGRYYLLRDLRHIPCQRLQDSGGDPEPERCPHLRHHRGCRGQAQACAEQAGDHAGTAETAGHQGCFCQLGLARPSAAHCAGEAV